MDYNNQLVCIKYTYACEVLDLLYQVYIVIANSYVCIAIINIIRVIHIMFSTVITETEITVSETTAEDTTVPEITADETTVPETTTIETTVPEATSEQVNTLPGAFLCFNTIITAN